MSGFIKIELHTATLNDQPVVRNMVGYYIYDMSEHMKWPCQPNGTYDGCGDLDRYFKDPRNHAFLLKAGKELAGFALVDGAPTLPNVDFRIGEFFVVRKFRRTGAGAAIAQELFDRFQGRWQLDWLSDNAPAAAFWKKIVGDYSKGDFTTSTTRSPWGAEDVLFFKSRLLKKGNA